LQLGEHGSNENARLDPEKQSIRVIRNPDAGPAEFLVRLELAMFADFLEVYVELDRRITPAGVVTVERSTTVTVVR
jgi:hypothetical protein